MSERQHTGGVSNCIWLARPLLLNCGPASGKEREPLLLLKEGLAALSKALQALLGLCSLEVDLTTTILPAAPSLSLC